ncbi:hypothetical protein HPP92_004633 [Vanilla planifolia]|uniref:Uncharacterized protein n=1 Tax=Vanilla planifolia TaxID=51239 RepID=A0A835RN23_VANPL|nr:hypothetical protein HPP92_004633 [Vanilla planifolia]
MTNIRKPSHKHRGRFYSDYGRSTFLLPTVLLPLLPSRTKRKSKANTKSSVSSERSLRSSTSWGKPPHEEEGEGSLITDWLPGVRKEKAKSFDGVMLDKKIPELYAATAAVSTGGSVENIRNPSSLGHPLPRPFISLPQPSPLPLDFGVAASAGSASASSVSSSGSSDDTPDLGFCREAVHPSVRGSPLSSPTGRALMISVALPILCLCLPALPALHPTFLHVLLKCSGRRKVIEQRNLFGHVYLGFNGERADVLSRRLRLYPDDSNSRESLKQLKPGNKFAKPALHQVFVQYYSGDLMSSCTSMKNLLQERPVLDGSGEVLEHYHILRYCHQGLTHEEELVKKFLSVNKPQEI